MTQEQKALDILRAIAQRVANGQTIGVSDDFGFGTATVTTEWSNPPRSSCWMCPNMRMDEWRQVREDERDWPKVIQFDKDLRQHDSHIWMTSQALLIELTNFDDANEVMFGRDRGACNSGLCFV